MHINDTWETNIQAIEAIEAQISGRYRSPNIFYLSVEIVDATLNLEIYVPVFR
jgi:hypothetical protein